VTARAYLAPPAPRVLAHRGLALDAVENTLPAFDAAVRAGAIYVETDTQVSADGVAVLAHDPTLDRIAGDGRRVDRLTAAELAALDLGRGAGVPSLAELLESLPDVRVNLDVKTAGAAEPTARAIRDARAEHRVLIGSFSDRRRRAALDRLTAVATSASSATVAVAAAAARLGRPEVLARVLHRIDALQIPETHRGIRLVDERLVAAYHRAGVEVHVWTVNSPVDMRRLLAFGVDGIVTDRADLALEVVASAS